MGLTTVLARSAARRAHVLTVEVPGQWALRATLERRCVARGWVAALSPADADVLAVCGRPGPQLRDVIERVWDQMPGPRVRIDIDDPELVDEDLDRAAAALIDRERHRHDSGTRAAPHGHDESHGDGHEHHDMDHGDMDHGDMEMVPAGIALADGAEDRDGLEMDVLHVPLGPVLAYWPAGLVLRCSLHGDVIAEAEARILDGGRIGSAPTGDGTDAAARQCDHVTSLLALAGWPRAAVIARRARDLLLADPRNGGAEEVLDSLHRIVRRSRLLRWSLRDLDGDVYDRLLARIGRARDRQPDPLSDRPSPEALPDLVTGRDVATARLVIAGTAIETAPAGTGGRR
ncbi:MAG: hypothetical protein WAM92_15085 [Mycobacterium sp.]